MFPRNFNEAVKSGFVPYILEANGRDDLCTVRTAKINAIIKDFKYLVRNHVDINDDSVQLQVFARHNLSRDSLTSTELNKITREINGR